MSPGAAAGQDMPDGAQRNVARDWATQHNVQHGDLHVHQGERSYRVDEFRSRPPSVPPSARRQPSRLLAARYQVVDFIGRDHELTQLADWRDDPALGLAVRLVHGPGGQGKTRLAAKFAQRCAELGWTVAQAVHRSYDTAPSSGLDAAQVAGSHGLLVIVDYAERWPVGDLLALAQDPLLRTGLPTRVLLLARPAGAWWDSLSYRLEDRYDMIADQLPLTAVADTQASRTTVFTAARDRFAGLLDVPDPGRIPAPTRLDEDAFGLVLTVHMAALAAVDAYARGNTPPADPAMLSAYLLKRERDHWQSMFDNDQRVHTPPQMMARAVFTATLTRPLPYPDALTALRQVAIPDPGQVLDDHRLCYPPTDPATVCEPLYPDRLGEDFLALQTPGHGLTGHQPDPWADTTVVCLLTGTDDGDGNQQPPPYTPQAVTVLIETARRWPHIARCQLFPLLRAQPNLAVAAGGAALARLAYLPDVDLGVLEAIEALLPTGRHVDLDIAIAAITARLTTDRLAATSDPADRARLYANLGCRLANAGQREKALEATVEAVEIRRRLAGVNPAAFKPDLAKALNNLANYLSNLRRREDALGAAVEAVEIWRQLAGANPVVFEPDLARTLTNLAVFLSNLGRQEKALEATVEAVKVYRRLAEVNPVAFRPDLARTLTNLAVFLSNLRRREDALGATVEAVEIWRRLAGMDPAAFGPDLAAALTNLGADLSDLGRQEKALEATIEAVEVYRWLAGVNPAAFEPNLAAVLNNFGMMLSDLGQREGALGATVEAVEIRRRLAERNPAVFEPDLARALWGFTLVRVAGQVELPQALTAAEESVAIYDVMVQRLPQAFTNKLRGVLAALADVLDGLGRGEEAAHARHRIDRLEDER